MERVLNPLTPPLRIAVAAALLLCAVLFLLRFVAALGGAAAVYTPAVHAVLAVLAALAGVGLWRQTRWAPLALVAFGCAFAAARLVDAFVLGIRPWLFALLSAAAALVVALLVAAWARERTPPLSGG
jgi:hypothetical protein